MNCPRCAEPVGAGARFCASCGGSLQDAPIQESDRRQLTVMFCDLVGSTALAAQLDPEDMSEAVEAYQQSCRQAVEEYGGTIAQYLGDGLLVYFGYPHAFEDSPDRALRAGLRILEVMPSCTERMSTTIPLLREKPLQVRIGVHTGPVVMTAPEAGGRQLAIGETPNLAARLQGEASPDTLVISGSTKRLLVGAFEIESLPPRELRGFDGSNALYRVVSLVDDGLRSRTSAVALDAPFVGRNAELAYLETLWQRARQGQGRGVIVQGDPGIGKSRLIEALRQRLQGTSHDWIELHGSAFHEHSSFFPLIECFRERLGLALLATDEQRIERISQEFAAIGIDDRASADAVASLCGSALQGDELPPPEERRRRTIGALGTWLRGSAANSPRIVVCDDLHWVDPSTLEVLIGLVQASHAEPLLVLLGSRNEPVRDWAQFGVTTLQLPPLDSDETREWVRTVVADSDVDEEWVRIIVERADGVPIFIQELTRSVLSRGSADRIPETLRDSLAVRLDRLGPARGLAQLASVFGRDFSFDQLRRLANRPDAEVDADLDRLLESGLIEARDGVTERRFRFCHALLQDSAYESLLNRQRRKLHARVATNLSAEVDAPEAAQPELIARHYRLAGLPEDAIRFLRQAAELSQLRFALQEAAVHFRAALELLVAEVPESAQRDLDEIELRFSLGSLLISIGGLVSPEGAAVMAPLRDLCLRTGQTMRLFYLNLGRAIQAAAGSDYEAVIGLAAEMRSLLDAARTPEVGASRVGLPLGGALGMLGRPADAIAELVPMYEAATLEPDDPEVGVTRGLRVMALTWMADNYWLLGDIAKARAASELALELGTGDENPPHVRAQALIGASGLAICRRDLEGARTYASRLLEIADEFQLPVGNALANIGLAWVQCEDGDPSGAVERFDVALKQLLDVGTTMKLSSYWLLFAAAHLRAGNLSEARALLRRAETHADQTRELYMVPELHRLQAKVDLTEGRVYAARGGLAAAAKAVEELGAPVLAIRIATLRCELEALHGSAETRKAAQMTLAAAVAGFDPASEERDLVDARAWLAPESVGDFTTE